MPFMARANAAYYATRDPFADFTTAPEIARCSASCSGCGRRWPGSMMGAPAPVILCRGRARPRHADGRCAARDRARSRAGVPRRAAAASGRDLAAAARAQRAARLPDARLARRARGRCRAGRCCCSPTSSSTRCRSASSCAAAAAGRSASCADGAFVERAAPTPPRDAADRATIVESRRSCRGDRRGARRAAGARRRRGAVHRLRPRTPRARATACRRCATAVPPIRSPIPARADLTAHVDFAALAAAARAGGAAACRGRCRRACSSRGSGSAARTDALARGQPPAAPRRWSTPRAGWPSRMRMGRLFKALALCHPALPAPPGFAA